jgi:hypothetical protein
MATTYDFTNGSIGGAAVPRVKTAEENEVFFLRNIVDFSLQDLEAGETDVAQVIDIPAATTVITAWLRIMTAETADGTVDLGYGGNPDVWGDALAVDSIAGSIVGYLWVPVYFASADTIDITATTDSSDVDIDGLKVEVVAMCVKNVDTF